VAGEPRHQALSQRGESVYGRGPGTQMATSLSEHRKRMLPGRAHQSAKPSASGPHSGSTTTRVMRFLCDALAHAGDPSSARWPDSSDTVVHGRTLSRPLSSWPGGGGLCSGTMSLWPGDDLEHAQMLREQTDFGHPRSGTTSGVVAYVDGEISAASLGGSEMRKKRIRASGPSRALATSSC